MIRVFALSANVLFALMLAAIPFIYILRRRTNLAEAQPTETPDGLEIPVNGIYTRGGGWLGGFQRNSLRPELKIGRSGILFRAVSRKEWPFAAVAHVEARPRRNGWKLIFVGRTSGSVVVADIIGEANVLAALRALPDGLALTEQAALLRNGSTGAARYGLHLYRGPIA